MTEKKAAEKKVAPKATTTTSSTSTATMDCGYSTALLTSTNTTHKLEYLQQEC